MRLTIIVFLLFHVETALSHPSVIIVGAGAAGVAAGTRLLKHNFTNLLILEAENRIGGRINSVFFGDAYVDLGAEWCAGEQGNIVYNLVKDLNLVTNTELTKTVYHSSKKNLGQDFQKNLLKVMNSVYETKGVRSGNDGMTLGHYLLSKYNNTVHEKFGDKPEELGLAKEAVDLFHHMVLRPEGAFSWFDLSADRDYRMCEGNQRLNWNGLGYKTILEVLMRKIPDASKQLPLEEKVLFNKEVVTVSWGHNSTSVICSDLSFFEADHVIFTPSIGVMKATHQRMFNPPLPEVKKEAIDKTGFGAVMKVAARFKESWWGSNFTGFYLTWSEDDRNKVLEQFPKGPSKDGRSWLTEVFGIFPAENNSHVLVVWLTGPLIPEIELISEETMTEGIEFILRKFVGHRYNVTAPVSTIRSMWHSNFHFRGTYSFQTLEARMKNVSVETELSKPLFNDRGRPVVMFAGEATHPYYYSTVHGAIETGFREADRIINMYK